MQYYNFIKQNVLLYFKLKGAPYPGLTIVVLVTAVCHIDLKMKYWLKKCMKKHLYLNIQSIFTIIITLTAIRCESILKTKSVTLEILYLTHEIKSSITVLLLTLWSLILLSIESHENE